MIEKTLTKEALLDREQVLQRLKEAVKGSVNLTDPNEVCTCSFDGIDVELRGYKGKIEVLVIEDGEANGRFFIEKDGKEDDDYGLVIVSSLVVNYHKDHFK